MKLYVSKKGNDSNNGTINEPFATLAKAQEIAQAKNDQIDVIIREGTYYQNETIVLTSKDSNTTYKAYEGENVTLSGGKKLSCNWKQYKDGIMMCELPDVKSGKLDFDQLFVNGQRQHIARYPNYDANDEVNGGFIYPVDGIKDGQEVNKNDPDSDMSFSSGADIGIHFNHETFTNKTWSRPQDAIIHIFMENYWGNLQWKLQNVDYEKNIIWFGEGGHQMGAKWHTHPSSVSKNSKYFIENIFEELDSPGEWYLDRDDGVIYYMPEIGVDLEDALVEVAILDTLIQFESSQKNPSTNVVLEGLTFSHTARTFMKKYDIPSLGDWAIHRGGTILMEGTKDCLIKNCFFDAIGGNAVFMNKYNRDNIVEGCTFKDIGESAICFVGSLETTVGTQRDFCYKCTAYNNLIYHNGRFGKQTAGVYISRAKCITVSHNHMHTMPRAGICIADGTWGGHLIEYNHIHDTCLETGDHGPLNAWGREASWCNMHSMHDTTTHEAGSGVCHGAGDVLLEAMETVIIRNNFFKEKSGWGLDLDDGASNYEIYNNLCVGVSFKAREGAYRTVYNNIWVNGANSPCFHIGNSYNHDKYYNNITVMSIAGQSPEDDLNFEMGAAYGEIYTFIFPPSEGYILEECDNNCFFSDVGKFIARVRDRSGESYTHSLEEWQALGYDKNSVFAEPMFVDAENDDYRVKPESPALKVGFKNFEMGKWGLVIDK